MSAAAPPAPAAPAELPARVAARAIDALLLVGIDVALGLAIGFGFDWLLLGSALVLAWFALLDARWGATPGKALLGLRVIGPDGGRPTLRQALLREAFTVVGAIPFVGPLLALGAWVAIAVGIRSSPLRQGFHDHLAGGTRVVRA